MLRTLAARLPLVFHTTSQTLTFLPSTAPMLAPRPVQVAVASVLTEAAHAAIAADEIPVPASEWLPFEIRDLSHQQRKRQFNHTTPTIKQIAHQYVHRRKQAHPPPSSSPVTELQLLPKLSKAEQRRQRKAREKVGEAVTNTDSEEHRLAHQWSLVIQRRAQQLLDTRTESNSPLRHYTVQLHANAIEETKRGGGIIDVNIQPRTDSDTDGALMEVDHQTLASTPSLPPPVSFTPIGYLESVYRLRYGTPRQGSITPLSRARLTLLPHISHHSLSGLDEYSHCWLIFVFHNNENKMIHPKIEPPRLGGAKVGLFASRTPHRYNNIGLSLVKIDSVVQNRRVIHFSSIDLIHGTPIIDIKPYNPADAPSPLSSLALPSWLHDRPSNPLAVTFTDSANTELQSLLPSMEFYSEFDDAKAAIIDSISFDPRPLYVKAKKEAEAVYGFRFDALNVNYSVDDDRQTATVCCVEVVTVDGDSHADTQAHSDSLSMTDEKTRTRKWLESVGRKGRMSWIEMKREEKRQKQEQEKKQQHGESATAMTDDSISTSSTSSVPIRNAVE